MEYPSTNTRQPVLLETQEPTYACFADDYAVYTAATDMMVLQNPVGSNKILLLSRVVVSGDATAAALQDVYGWIRDTLDTGGTATNPTVRQYNKLDPAPTGIVQLYSALPTLGLTGSVIRAGHFVFPAAATPAFAAPEAEWTWGNRSCEIPMLYPGQQFSLSNNGNAVAAGLSLYLGIEWKERG